MTAAPAQPDQASILTRGEMPHIETADVASGTAVWLSHRSPVKETENEDGVLVLRLTKARAVLAVTDGLGGHAGGARAAEITLHALAEATGSADLESEDSLRSAIVNGFEAANQAVLDLSIGAGATLSVIEINNHTIRPYHVGDSQILVTGQRGKLKLITVAHSPVGFAVESGMLNEQEAIHHEDRHIVSNIVGSNEMRIEIGPPMTLAQRDTVLLASDGLFDNLHRAEIVELIRKGALTGCAKSLANACRMRMCEGKPGEPSKPDDLTLLLYRQRRAD